MLAALLATLWFLSAVSAAGGLVVALLFGGDWTEALFAASVLAAAVFAFRLLGLKGALAVLAAGAVAISYRPGERFSRANQA